MAVTRAIDIRTGIPGPRSKEILDRKEQVVAEPLSIFLPVVVAEGHGATITDVDGNASSISRAASAASTSAIRTRAWSPPRRSS